MSNHTVEPWVIKEDMIYGANGKVSIACVMDIAFPYGIRGNSDANSKRIISCVNALAGLSDNDIEELENTLACLKEVKDKKDNWCNKPSWKNAPEWANYAAMDSQGMWYWYENKPVRVTDAWDVKDFGKSHVAEVIGWEDSLEERP